MPEAGPFSLEVENLVGNKPLTLDSETYVTSSGDQFKVSTFKYYLSNVQLNRADNTKYLVPDSYFLIDQASPGSRTLRFKDVPAGDYTSLTFTVGVDSTRTKAGNFSGVLEADKGMFWEWTKEFINVKLEGSSPQSTRGGLVFHVAGYQGANGANNTIRTVTLPFPNGGKLLIRADHAPEVHLHTDVLRLFGAPNTVRFAEVNTVHHGPWLVKIADNIAAGMFRVGHIRAE